MTVLDASAPVLAFRGVGKTYHEGAGVAIHALKDVTFEVRAGQTVAIMGRSGSGKSTLLHLAAGIDRPTSGSIALGGRDLARLSDGQRTLARRDAVGLVFQFFHLLPELGVLDNVLLPTLVAGDARAPSVARARLLLERLGLAARARDPVRALSGGEMQRVALGRALVRRPHLVLADEPTGNLDDETGRSVMDLLLAVAVEQGAALIYATHSPELARRAGLSWTLSSGVLERAGQGP